jgi:hypothetical protein
MMRAYTPEDVFNFAGNGDSTSLTTALTISSNRSGWYTNGAGWNADRKSTRLNSSHNDV